MERVSKPYLKTNKQANKNKATQYKTCLFLYYLFGKVYFTVSKMGRVSKPYLKTNNQTNKLKQSKSKQNKLVVYHLFGKVMVRFKNLP